MSIESKKTFLLQSSLVYEWMTQLTSCDVIRRYLAFRIIVNAMSFEDVVGSRATPPHIRKIRDVLLAHKQEDDFFEGFKAADEITNASVSQLLSFMRSATSACDNTYLMPELVGGQAQATFVSLIPHVLKTYEEDFLVGVRVTNNFLCHTGVAAHEITDGDLPGVFYRYRSSMALFQLAQYIHSNTYQFPELLWTTRNAKLDMLLHAQNLADCAIKDIRNSHSIDGLLEVMTSGSIGNPAPLLALVSDPRYQTLYAAVRLLRNKLIGHMDKHTPLVSLLSDLDIFPLNDVIDLVHMIDYAMHEASNSHIAIRLRFVVGNERLPASTSSFDPQTIDGFKTRSYF